MAKRKKLAIEELKAKSPFERWQVIGDEIVDNKVLCRCSCEKATEKMVDIYSLWSSGTKSCGCLRVQRCRENFTTHGHTGSRTYNSWADAVKRCRDVNDERYGKRGIRVCARWLGEEGFANFLEDMGERQEGEQINRKDNDGGYWCGKEECPECGPLGREPNCNWVTPKKNSNNRGSNINITIDGVEKTLTEWCEEHGHKDINKIIYRHETMGMSWEEALTAGDNLWLVRVPYRGEMKTYQELEELSGKPWRTIRARHKYHNYTVEEAVHCPLFTRLSTYRKQQQSSGDGAGD